ncbi:MAG TPA: low molecular weight phosphatase family protein [Candidatus Competibacter sp.]|nr:low molecular weight phosphatase family protein [Candidatus Competibacter sp.]
MKRILFLCTGNYYRSRFCEEYFNHRAKHRDLLWRADSRGLAPDVTVFRNPGPLSPQTLEGLRALGVDLDGDLRYPLPARLIDFARADRAIALSRCEHGPMVESFFPEHERAVEYWEVGDVEIESPASAIEKMIELTDRLVDEIRSGCGHRPTAGG